MEQDFVFCDVEGMLVEDKGKPVKRSPVVLGSEVEITDDELVFRDASLAEFGPAQCHSGIGALWIFGDEKLKLLNRFFRFRLVPVHAQDLLEMTHAGLINDIGDEGVSRMKLPELFILVDCLNVVIQKVVGISNPELSLDCIGA